MAVLGRKRKLAKKHSSGKRKRRQEEDDFEEEDHDEFFENDDDGAEAGNEDAEAEADLKETPEDARRRLGVIRDPLHAP